MKRSKVVWVLYHLMYWYSNLFVWGQSQTDYMRYMGHTLIQMADDMDEGRVRREA